MMKHKFIIEAINNASAEAVQKIFIEEGVSYERGIGAGGIHVFFTDSNGISILNQWIEALKLLNIVKK